MAKNIANRAHGRYSLAKDKLVILHSTLTDPRASQVFEFIVDAFRRTIKQFGDREECIYEFDHKEFTNGTVRTTYITRRI